MLPVLIAAALLAGAGAAAAPAGAATAAGHQAAELPVIRVAGKSTSRHLRAGSRPVYLRGVNVNALVDYGTAVTPVALTEPDYDQMAALGFNVMRLGVSWGRVLPRPGRLDQAYLGQITAAVRAAGRRGIYTVISSHSDRYAAGLGTGTEFDGAPGWAVDTGGQPCGNPGRRYYTPCAAAAARRFYAGTSVAGRPLTTWYVSAVAAMARAGRAGGAGYIGIDLINEPTDPDAAPEARPTRTWTKRLHRLQSHIVRRLRRDGERAPVWVQPQGSRSTSPGGTPALASTLPGKQIVYAPHAYVDTHGTQPSAATPRRLKQQYQRFAREAQQLGAALVIGEFPGAAGGSWDVLRRHHITQQTSRGIGGIAWVWKQPAVGGYGWHTVDLDGTPRLDSDAGLVLSAPRIIAGRRGARISRTGDRVTLRTRGRAQTLDVWLGTRFSAGSEPVRAPVLESADRAHVLTHTHRAVASSRVAYGGTLVRVRVKRGTASVSWSLPG